jgi:hypothetical protein
MTRPAEDRLARALDRVQAGDRSNLPIDDDAEILELLEPAAAIVVGVVALRRRRLASAV